MIPRVRIFDGRPYRLKSTHRLKRTAKAAAAAHRSRGPRHRARIVPAGRGWAVYGNPCGGKWYKGVATKSRGAARRAFYAQQARERGSRRAQYRRSKATDPATRRQRKLAAVAKRAKRSSGRAPF